MGLLGWLAAGARELLTGVAAGGGPAFVSVTLAVVCARTCSASSACDLSTASCGRTLPGRACTATAGRFAWGLGLTGLSGLRFLESCISACKQGKLCLSS